MVDLLVKLYELPDVYSRVEQLQKENIVIRRGLVCERTLAVNWAKENFGKLWASECSVAFCRQPVSCFLATREREVVGFACYDSSMKNFFGPVGVDENLRGKGIGATLLLSCLQAMAAGGYAYGIVGDVDSPHFYQKTVNAIVIPDSTPGVYRDRLRG